MFRKGVLLFSIALLIVVVAAGCAKKNEVAQTPTTQDIILGLLPANQETKAEQFAISFSDLKITKTVDLATKEIQAPPHLQGNLKIKNTSNNILDIQGVTVEYLNDSGIPIAFKTGEKNVSLFLSAKQLQPGKETENSLDITVPIAAVKERTLKKIHVNVIYVPSPVKRESVDLSVRMETKS